MDNRTKDFMDAARQRVSEITLDLVKRADTKEQAMHIAIAAATGALGTAAGALAAFRGDNPEEIDYIAFAREVLEMMEAARR
jgi:hypothetical protein